MPATSVVIACLFCAACAGPERGRSVSATTTLAVTPPDAAAPLADQRSVALGPVAFQVTISRTAQIFYFVDEISLWESHCHKQYARWADEQHVVGPRERSLLEAHKRLRSASGGWGALDQAFASPLSIREAASRAVTAGLLTPADAEQERAVLEAFEPLLARTIDEGYSQLEAFRALLVEREPTLGRVLSDVQGLAETYSPQPIPLFLVTNPVGRSGGGGFNGGIAWVEVNNTLEAIDTFTHEAIHVVLRDRDRDIRATATACGAGLDRETLNEGLDYAISPGMFHEGNGDPLGEAVDAARRRGQAGTDQLVRDQRLGLALRPLLESALGRKQKLSAILPKACDAWRGVLAEPWPVAGTAPFAPPVFIVADAVYRQWLVDRLRALGVPSETRFSTDLDALLPRAAGHTLVIAMVGDRLVLPEKYWPAQTVISLGDLRRRQGETALGVFRRQRSDGTLVYVLYGHDPDSLRKMVEEFPP